MDKRSRQLKKLADKYGRTVVKGRTHNKLICNRGVFTTVFVSQSPSDQRAIRNIEGQLKNPKRKDDI